jgi:hypothetical protein
VRCGIKKKNGEIHSGIISAIRIFVYDQESNVCVQYGIKTPRLFDDVDYYEWFWDFYSTKEELLKGELIKN